MDKPTQRKKNIDVLEDIQLTLKGLLTETDQLKRDIRYIKTFMQTKEKVKQDLDQLKKHQEPIETGWRLW